MNRVSDRIIVTAIIAVIIGIVLGILFFNGIVLATTLAELTSFVIPITLIELILLFVLAGFGNRKETRRPVREYGTSILWSGILSLILGITILVLVGIIVADALWFAILIGLSAAAFTWNYLLFIGLFNTIIKLNILKSEEPFC